MCSSDLDEALAFAREHDEPVLIYATAQPEQVKAVQAELEHFARDDQRAPVALCDRGIADGAAYWPEGPDSFFAALGTTAQEVFARYSTVIHLRTPTAAMGYDNSNPMRTETAIEAAELDRRIERVWEAHPNRLVVPATETFTEKLEQVTTLIRTELTLQRLSRERFVSAPSSHIAQEFLN